MASGKTTVGEAVARRLGWRHVDLDHAIEAETGTTVEELFATVGEQGFRALEMQLTERFIAEEQLIFSPGGGWITNPGALSGLPAGSLTIWLRVSTDEVLRRLGRVKDQPVRPLLQGVDPRSRVEGLMAEREPLYRQARLTIDSDRRSVDEIVETIEAVLNGSLPIPADTDLKAQNGG
jgi:3-dehydroquinate synthase